MDDTENWDAKRLGSRQAPRQQIRLMVQARNGQHRREAEAMDLSSSGVRLRTLNPLRLGSVHWLKIGTLEALEVTVVWVDGFTSGCQFTKPIHPAVYQTMLETFARG